ncbi:MAG: hypothetical protein ACI4SS_07085 [Clostridia bacterium]
MMKERVKTSAIIILCVNLVFLTCRLWFGNDIWQGGIADLAQNLPIVRELFRSDELSIPRNSLSKPRKILINDGSLWIAYYNTDVAFSPIENRTRQIIEAYLRGEAVNSKSITFKEWQSALESVGIYVEYPIAYSTEMLCSVMGINSENSPKDVSAIRDFIIIPSTEETGVFVLVRDAYDDSDAHIYQFGRDSFSLPAEDLTIYTENHSGYYEPAFSTGLEPEGVSLDSMVLFSDSHPSTSVLISENPIESRENGRRVLSRFFKNVDTAGSYDDVDGVQIYVENYGDARIYPNGLFEYKAISSDKGVRITERYSSYYETVNSAISFVEELWSEVSREPLSVLVSCDLTQGDSRKIHLTMDYYQGGRPVEVSLASGNSFEQLNHGIEMDIADGMIVSYRQFFRSFSAGGDVVLEDDFISALDYFVNNFSYRRDTVIKDIYVGYIDRGADAPLEACWLAKINGDDVVYSYSGGTEEGGESR